MNMSVMLWTWAGLSVLCLAAAALVVVAEVRIEDPDASQLAGFGGPEQTPISAASERLPR